MIVEGIPTAADCATVNTNIPYDIEWKIEIGSIYFQLNPPDYAVPGINQSLYFTNPTMDMDGYIFSCAIENPGSRVRDTCYIQVAMQMQGIVS